MHGTTMRRHRARQAFRRRSDAGVCSLILTMVHRGPFVCRRFRQVRVNAQADGLDRATHGVPPAQLLFAVARKRNDPFTIRAREKALQHRHLLLSLTCTFPGPELIEIKASSSNLCI